MQQEGKPSGSILRKPTIHVLIGYTDVYRNFINGQFVESQATEWIDVLDPVSHLKPRDSAIFNSNKLPFSPLKHY